MQHFSITFGLTWEYPTALLPNDESDASQHRACSKPDCCFYSWNDWDLYSWSSCFAMAPNFRINLILNGEGGVV